MNADPMSLEGILLSVEAGYENATNSENCDDVTETPLRVAREGVGIRAFFFFILLPFFGTTNHIAAWQCNRIGQLTLKQSLPVYYERAM